MVLVLVAGVILHAHCQIAHKLNVLGIHGDDVILSRCFFLLGLRRNPSPEVTQFTQSEKKCGVA